jgi:[ribosomal protein S18]-alanine N-acetyltransferase
MTTDVPTVDAVASHDVHIVPMTADHLDAVLAIERAAAPHPWTRGIFEDELAHTETRSYFAALVSDQVVGFGGVLVQVGEAHITNVAVHETFRRNGIARALMIRLMAAAVSGSATAATLEVRTSNVGAQRMYHRFGFVPAGVRPRYYPDGEDAVIMWADDITSPIYAERLAALTQRTHHSGDNL